VELNSALGLGVRWAHLAACLLVVGAFGALVLAGPAPRPTALAWEQRVSRAARAMLLVALASGVLALAQQAALAEGRPDVGAAAMARYALETQGGVAWLARHGLLVLLAAFAALSGRPRPGADWVAARGESALLAAVALGLLAASGHAAAVEPDTARAVAVDAVHLLAAGAWIGGLAPLAALLAAAARETGADARPYAVLAARRFSRLGLVALATLALTGAANTAVHVGSVAGLLGTTYGRLLCLKLALLVPIAALAAVNRRRLLPALAGEAATVGRPAMRRLAAFVVLEAAIALLLLLVVAAMAVTPPARHEEPVWPLSFRLTTVALADDPAGRARLLVGSQVAILGAAAALAGLTLRARRAPLLAGGGVLVAAGLALAMPALAVDAYPTTYVRPAVPYHASSIVRGARRYAEHCAACHGPRGAGDGPAAAGLPVPPADLRAAHTAHHTAGDLFWWVTHGIPGRGMPGAGDRLAADERWDVVNFVRTLGAAAIEARRAAPAAPPSVPIAPDFAFAVGPVPDRSLREYRGRRAVLVVIYTLPASRARLTELARAYRLIAALGGEVIAVPRDPAPDAIRRLGDEPPVLFPVVTEGAADIVRAYGLLADGPHAEFLVDRRGYLRGISAGPPPDTSRLLDDLQALSREAELPPAEDHVH